MLIRVACSLAVLVAAGISPGLAGRTSGAADAALQAHRNGDLEKLTELAESDRPDPWLVAEELLFRGEKAAARALATAAERPDLAGLDGCLSKQEKYPADPDARTACGKALTLLRERKAAEALRKAQEHIRSQEKWAHPYYWAAWQLWGRGE